MLSKDKHRKQYIAIFEVDEQYGGMIFNNDSFYTAETMNAKNERDAKIKALKKQSLQKTESESWKLKGIAEKVAWERWIRLWKKVAKKHHRFSDYCAKFFADLIAQYTEAHRVYHTLVHINHCLNEFEQACYLAMNPNAVEMAIWYHDVVYDPRTRDNEEKSAEFIQNMDTASIYYSSLLPTTFVKQVVNLILATKHAGVPTIADAQLLVDIDLSIFGQSKEEFDEYEHQIRKEYEWVPEKKFIAERSVIIKSFLERPTIYSTIFFRDKYETRARQNLARSLIHLQSH